MGPRALAHGLCVVWLCLVAVSAVHEDADSPTPLVDGELVLLGEAGGSATAFYCTPKGESSPQYAYNDKNCASDGKVQQCGGGRSLSANSRRIACCTTTRRNGRTR